MLSLGRSAEAGTIGICSFGLRNFNDLLLKEPVVTVVVAVPRRNSNGLRLLTFLSSHTTSSG